MDNQEEDENSFEEFEIAECIALDGDGGGSCGVDPENEVDDQDMAVDTVDTSILTFSSHSGSVFCVDLLPGTSGVAASGGEDNTCYIWDIQSGQILGQDKDHEDSVTYCKFNSKGTLLASGDLSGKINILECSKFTVITQVNELDNDLEWLQWHSVADILISGDSKGCIWMFLIKGKEYECKLFANPGQCKPCTAAVWLPCRRRLLAGYGDGILGIWDLKEASFNRLSMENDANREESAIICLVTSPQKDMGLVASGSEDGFVRLFHIDEEGMGKITHFFQVPQDDPYNATECLSFCPQKPSWLAVGTIKGDLMLIETDRNYVQRFRIQLPDSPVKFAWLEDQSSSPVLIAGCLDGVVRLVQMSSGEIMAELHGHQQAILDFTYDSNRNIIITSSDDGCCKIFDTKNNNK